MASTLETIQAILQDKLDVDPAEVTPEATLESLKLDSLDLVELVCELEDQLNIDFGDPEGLSTVGEIVEYVDGLK